MSYLIKADSEYNNRHFDCPYCDNPIDVQDGFECFRRDGDEGTLECPYCDEDIKVTVSFSVDYDGERIEG